MTGTRIRTGFIILGALVCAAGCAPRGATSRPVADQVQTTRQTEMSTDDYHSPLTIENVRSVMYAKLAHTQALFEGMVTEDLQQVAKNADELNLLSKEAGFRPHRTVTYGVYSDEFGTIAARIARNARRDDVEAVQRDYVRLTNTCIQCHAHLRQEHLKLDLPGSVSMR